MKASLKSLGSVLLLVYVMCCVFLPIASPWFFLLSIPMFLTIPHMGKIMDYLTDWMHD